MPPHALYLHDLTGEVLSLPIQESVASPSAACGDELREPDNIGHTHERARRPRRGLHVEGLPLGPLLPSQFILPPQQLIRKQGAPALMIAILKDAIDCFEKQLIRKSLEAQRAGEDAQKWLFQNDEEWIFSFVNICEVLDLDPHKVRRELSYWREQHLHAAAASRHEWPSVAARKK